MNAVVVSRILAVLDVLVGIAIFFAGPVNDLGFWWAAVGGYAAAACFLEASRQWKQAKA